MSRGSIIKRVGPRGVGWLLKYDGAPDLVSGKRRQKYRTVRGTHAQAERELRRLLQTLDDGTHVDSSKLTVGSWLETWLRDHVATSVSGKSLERYTQLVRLHLAPRLGAIRLQALTPARIQSAYSDIGAHGRRLSAAQVRAGKATSLSNATTLYAHRVLTSALNAAVRQRIITRSPCADVTSPRAHERTDHREVERPTIRLLEQGQIDALLTGLRGHWLLPIVAVATGTGARRGEVLALRWQDIDLTRGTVRIDRSVEDTTAHGVRFKAPKTRGSRRTISVDPGLLALLRAERARQAEILLKLGTRPPSGALVFPRRVEVPEVPLQPRWVTKAFAIQAKRLGLGAVRLHDLRHAHATALLTAGVPVNAVAARLGHASPMTTLTVYAHVVRHAEDHAASVAGSMLAAGLRDP